ARHCCATHSSAPFLKEIKEPSLSLHECVNACRLFVEESRDAPLFIKAWTRNPSIRHLFCVEIRLGVRAGSLVERGTRRDEGIFKEASVQLIRARKDAENCLVPASRDRGLGDLTQAGIHREKQGSGGRDLEAGRPNPL